MDLIKEIEHLDNSFTLKYFGTNDMYTGVIFGCVVKKFNFFEEIVKSLEQIRSMDEYVAYFIMQLLQKLDRDKDAITDDENIKKRFTEIINLIDDEKLKKLKGQVYIFLNQHVEEVFSLEVKNLCYLSDVTLDFIKDNGSRNSKLYEYLIEVRPWYFIWNFDDFKKLFGKNPQLFVQLLKCYENSDFHSKSSLLPMLLSARSKSKLKGIVDEFIDEYCQELEQALSSERLEDIYFIVEYVKELLRYLRKIKDKRAYHFEVLAENQEEKATAYLLEHGQEISCNIPRAEVLTTWDKSSTSYDKLKYIVSTSLDRAGGSKGLSDLLTLSDDYYTNAHVVHLENTLLVGQAVFYAIMRKDDRLAEYTECINEFLIKIDQLDDDLEEGVLFQGQMLLDNFKILANNLTIKDSTLISTLSYNVEMLACALIEKLLRKQFLRENMDKIYVPIKKKMLGSLLDHQNEVRLQAFSQEHLQNLKYYLGSVGKDGSLGHDYRNRLAHLARLKNRDLNPQIAARMMYLFTDVLVKIVEWNDFK